MVIFNDIVLLQLLCHG